MSFSAGVEDRCLAITVWIVHWNTCFDEELDTVDLAITSKVVECCLLKGVLVSEVTAMLSQGLEHLECSLRILDYSCKEHGCLLTVV